MKYMSLIDSDESDWTESEQLPNDMGHFSEELGKAGVKVAGEESHPSSKGAPARVAAVENQRPFSQKKGRTNFAI